MRKYPIQNAYMKIYSSFSTSPSKAKKSSLWQAVGKGTCKNKEGRSKFKYFPHISNNVSLKINMNYIPFISSLWKCHPNLIKILYDKQSKFSHTVKLLSSSSSLPHILLIFGMGFIINQHYHHQSISFANFLLSKIAVLRHEKCKV